MNRDDYPEYARLYDDLLEIADLACKPGYVASHSDFISTTLVKALQVTPLYEDTVSTITEVMVPVMVSEAHQVWFKGIADATRAASYPQNNLFQNGFREVVVTFSDLAGAYGAIKTASLEVVQALVNAYIKLLEVFNYSHTVTMSKDLLDQMDNAAAVAREYQLGMGSLLGKLFQIRAHYHIHQGEFDSAIHYAKRALSEYGNVDDLNGCADAASTLAIAYRESNLGKLSDTYLQQARKQAQEQGFSRRDGILLYEEGVRAYIEDVYTLALSYLDEALAIFETLEATHHIAMTNTMLAMTYIYMDDFSTGEAKIALARAGWQALKNDYELANLRFVDAVLDLRRGNRDVGMAVLDEAQAMAEKLPANESRRHLIDRIEDYRRKQR